MEATAAQRTRIGRNSFDISHFDFYTVVLAPIFFMPYRRGLPISTSYMETVNDKKGSLVRSFDRSSESGSVPLLVPPCWSVASKARWGRESYRLHEHSFFFKVLVSFRSDESLSENHGLEGSAKSVFRL